MVLGMRQACRGDDESASLGQDEEIRPELKGAMSYLISRLKEVWRWGKPNI